MLTRIALDMPQPVDAVALHKPHRPAIIIGPDRFLPIALLCIQKCCCGFIQSIGPRELLPLAAAFGAFALERLEKPAWMMNALGIAGDLLADHAQRIGMVL